MPSVKKAELVEGIVYMSSPVRVQHHSRPHALITTWLGTYWTATPGIDLCVEPTVRLDLDNEPQPDAVLRIEGGTSRIDEDDYIAGPPELIVEVAASSVSKDMNDKLKAYRRNGVQEYLVWQVEEQKVVWFSLRSGDYVPLEATKKSIICSRVFPGLWLDTTALLQGDLGAVLSVLNQGLQSPEHESFQQKLAG
jgi:Uma2 family endonuclease